MVLHRALSWLCTMQDCHTKPQHTQVGSIQKRLDGMHGVLHLLLHLLLQEHSQSRQACAFHAP